MKVLVVGATGGIGKLLIKKLTQNNHLAFGMIRNPEQKEIISKLGGTPIIGDLEKDISDIAKGFDAIISVFGTRGQPKEKDYPITVKGMQKLIDSAIKNKVKKFFYISSLNIDIPQEKFLQDFENYYNDKSNPEYLKLKNLFASDNYITYLKTKKDAEELLIKSGLDYLILRAGLLTNENEIGSIYLSSLPRGMGRISRGDVAETFVEALNANIINKMILYILDGKTQIKKAISML